MITRITYETPLQTADRLRVIKEVREALREYPYLTEPAIIPNLGRLTATQNIQWLADNMWATAAVQKNLDSNWKLQAAIYRARRSYLEDYARAVIGKMKEDGKELKAEAVLKVENNGLKYDKREIITDIVIRELQNDKRATGLTIFNAVRNLGDTETFDLLNWLRDTPEANTGVENWIRDGWQLTDAISKTQQNMIRDYTRRVYSVLSERLDG